MIDSAHFRKVMGTYPTGVCAITSMTDDGTPLGMVVGTFTSVSLSPALIGFFPDKSSTTWPKIQPTGRFCVNVIGANNLSLCKQLAVSGNDKFQGVDYRLSDNGSPILADVSTWIDCSISQVIEAGDHFLVLGEVLAMEAPGEAGPLLFHGGKYGSFAALQF